MQPEHPTSRPVQRLVLTGFMGAGKSTLGPILAARLGWRFVDADHQLQSETGASIADLFTMIGEPAFRKIEAEVVARLLGRSESVIALGGGAIETEATRVLLANSSNTCVIFLRASLDILIARCEQQAGAVARPILHSRDAVHQRFQTRLPHYESAHITVETEGLAPHIVADNLLQQMFEASYVLPLYQKAITT
jgi:shikimate kinase